MAASQHAGALDGPHNLERLAINDRDLLTVSNVQELLFRVRGQRQIPCKRRTGLDQLLDELAVIREHLDAPVFPIGHVHRPVVGHADGVHDAEILRTRIREALYGRSLTIVVIHRLVAEGAPHPLERAGIRIEDDDTVIAVTVGHERFVGLRMDP